MDIKTNWHFVADIHAYHNNIIKYCNRPFMSAEEREDYQFILAELEVLSDAAGREKSSRQRDFKISDESAKRMTDTIVDSINAAVKESDHLVILGDVIFSSKITQYQRAKEFRERLNCQDIWVILGNHDNYEVMRETFEHVRVRHEFNIAGKIVVCDHYPQRTWNRSHHGTYCLYGHVHGLFIDEDNCEFSPGVYKAYQKTFERVLQRHYAPYDDVLLRDLVNAAQSMLPMRLTLDVGVDNVRPGKPFGTPWSFQEICDHMRGKEERWKAQKDHFKGLPKARYEDR